MQTGLRGNIFDAFIPKHSLFEFKEVLRHSYTPEELPHREEEIKMLASILSSALKCELPSNILIYGKSGTGKTIVSKHVANELEIASGENGSKVKTVYLNCEITNTEYRALQKIAESFGESIPFTGWPTDKVYGSLVDSIEKESACCVIVVLDEIDRLVRKEGDKLIYTLTRINSELKNAKMSIIGISNDLRFTEYLDARVKSSLSEEVAVFKPYTAKQLEDILKERAKKAFKQDVLDEFVIPLCAAFAAKEHGDARKALDLLRVAGEIGERENAPKILEEHVRKAKERIEKDSVLEAVKSLPLHSKIILYVLSLYQEKRDRFVTTGNTYAVYKSICRSVGIETLTQRRVSDLISELELLGIVKANLINRGRYGRTREIKLDTQTQMIRSILKEEIKLKDIEQFSKQG